MGTRVHLYDTAFVKLNSPAGIVGRGVARAAGKTRDRAKQRITKAGRVDSGAMRQSVRAEEHSFSQTRCTWRVGSGLFYFIYQEKGVDGPVYPRRAKVLRFQPKGSSGFVFARKTKGFPGGHFLTGALRDLTRADFGKI